MAKPKKKYQRIPVGDVVHRTLSEISARAGMTFDEYLTSLLEKIAPEEITQARRRITIEKNSAKK